MEDKYRRAIIKNVQQLVKISNFNQLLDRLVHGGIYTEDMLDLLLAKESAGQKAQKLFLDLPTRGPRAFGVLCNALMKTGNNDVTVKMAEDIEDSVFQGDKNLKRASKFQIPPILEDEIDSSSNSSIISSVVTVVRPLKKFKCNDNIHSGHDEESIQKKHGKCITFGILENSCESSPSTQPLPEVQLCVFGNETPKFTVVPSTRLYSGYLNLSECYRMKSSPRGLALIINNIEFLGDPDAKRNGAQYDSVNLENLFTQMGYKVILVENVKKDDLLNYKTGILANFIKKLQEFDVDSCIISLNSHGFNRDFIRMSDPPGRSENSTAIDLVLDIIGRFSNRNFPDFHGKPKVFLVNACRGVAMNRGVRRCFGELEHRRIQRDGNNNDEQSKSFMGSEYSDIFIIRSTVPDYVSLRDLDRGTWFAECICKAFAEYSHELHFSDLKCKVSTFMESMFDDDVRKQSIHYEEFGNTKRLYFNPGL